jgi:uncharacterized membrane protein YgcG
MSLVRLLKGAAVVFGLLQRLVAVVVVTVVGGVVVQRLVRNGQLPPAPLGLAAMGLPATVFGLPTAYVGGIAVLDLFVLFGEGGGGTSVDGDVDGGFGDGGGFGGGGDGGGGGGGDGGE